MKRLFFAMAAMAAMLTSCSKDETTTAPVIERSTVTFTVNAPELSTRADEGEGLSATKLEYVIYDLAESPVNGANQIYGTADFSDDSDGDNNPLTTTVEVDLVEGRQYEAIFFAHAEGAPYTFNKTEQTMTINTTSLKANAESYDAFYKYVEPFVMPATGLTKTVEMTRPFAQLNVATDDYQNEKIPAGMMIDAATTGIEVEAYNTLNFKDGTVDGKETIIYALANKMDGTISANNENYSWLTMNYILVNTKENVGVKFLFTDEDKDGNEQTYTREYTAVPVQRNHKTNIIGSILTSETKFEVKILPGFETPEHDYNVDTTDEKVVTTAQELQKAIDDAIVGTNIIKLGKDITTGTQTSRAADAIMIPQTEGINIVIDGDGHTYNGTIYIDGNSRHTGTETLTFTNINFKHSTGDIDFISGNNQAEAYRYPHNVTIENCTFTGNTNGAVVGARFRQGYNINIVNCTAKDVFLLLWTTGGKGITVDGADVIVGDTGEGGLSFGTSTDIVVKNSTITNNNQTGYGVRVADNSTANNINISLENNTIKANYPVVARFMNVTNANDKSDCKDNVNMTFNGVNTLTATNANGYQVVFTHDNDNAPLAEPEDATITLTGADSYNVFPRDLVIAKAAELEVFRNAVNAGTSYKDKVVKLAANIDLGGIEWEPIGGDDGYANNFDGTFDGKGYTVSNFTVNNSKNAGFFGTLGGAVIKNLIIDNATLTTNHYAGGIVAWVESGATNSSTKPLIENCHVKNSKITLSAEQTSNGWDNGDKAGGIVGFAHNASIVGCSVEKTTITAYREAAGIVGYSNGATVRDNKVLQDVKLIQDNTHNYKNYTSEADVLFGDIVGRRGTNDILEGGNSGTVTKEGGIFDGYYIDANGAYNVFNAKGFLNVATTILTDANKDGAVVKLTDNIDLQGINWPAIEAKAGFTLDGNGKTISNLTANTVKNDGFDNVGMFCSIYKETTFTNLIVDKATVTGSGKGESHGAVLVATPRGYLTIEDVKVTNSTVSKCDRSAILTTYLYFNTAKVDDCVVEKCTINGIGTCGAILGMNNGHNFEMTNNKVIGSTISSSEGSDKAGIFIGTWQDAGTLTQSNNTHSETKAINAGEETNNTIGRHK